MLEFACPACAMKLKVKDEQAGRRGKCPRCGAAATAPTPAAARAGLPDAPTIPPQEHPAAEAPRDTNSDAEVTGGGPPSELTDFLAPPQGAGEVGRLGPYRILKIL